ncbi:hypothetical protein DFQ27_007362 [Actinomortierella ambigua]|uniref:GRAM domain-containing protein n=1 Tax=Actinomortierella ambigua TaxID=1343610 RepID=A0A9P6PVC8_9FUNG|nr:hypothetical protein DFQ27_007362 [Actinomortierella ambigua]
MSINWAMLTDDGTDIVPLENETIFWRKKGYSAKRGELLLTNQRVLYLSETPTPYFSNASIPLNKLEESKLVERWFSSSSYKAVVMPVPGGGMTQPGVLEMTFNEGGLREFDSLYRSLKERLHELDGVAPQHLEQLPTYEPREGASSSSSAEGSSSTPTPSATVNEASQPPTTATTAPPPQPAPQPSPATPMAPSSSNNTPLDAPPSYDLSR